MDALKPLPVVGTTRYSDFIRRFWLYGILILLLINSFVADFLIFHPSSPGQPLPIGAISLSPQNSCPSACVTAMNSLFSSQGITPSPTSTVKLVQASAPSSTPTLAPTAAPTPTAAPAQTREVFVPLGAGSGNPADWTSITGVAATIDTADYGNVKSATFEITLRVPTANQTVWARLIAIGNYAEVPGSEVSMTGGPTGLLVSSPLALPSGKNLYQVQLKTQLQYPVYIDQARIRIQSN